MLESNYSPKFNAKKKNSYTQCNSFHCLNLVNTFCVCKRSLREYVTTWVSKYTYVLKCRRIHLEYFMNMEGLSV